MMEAEARSGRCRRPWNHPEVDWSEPVVMQCLIDESTLLPKQSQHPHDNDKTQPHTDISDFQRSHTVNIRTTMTTLSRTHTDISAFQRSHTVNIHTTMTTLSRTHTDISAFQRSHTVNIHTTMTTLSHTHTQTYQPFSVLTQ